MISYRERVPVRIRCNRRKFDSTDYSLEMEAERFRGTLLHPISLSEMLSHCSYRHPGYRVTVYWPAVRRGYREARPGDVLEVGNHALPIRGVEERPGCYLALYVERD
ncbi:MAG: hypothetical protein ACRDFX_06370 [Chloroflexota bacterium]